MNVNIQTLKDIRDYLKNELYGIYPEQEIIAITNLIFKTHLGIDKLHLLQYSSQIISSKIVSRIVEICDELKTRKPLQYILGETSFYNCTIKAVSYTHLTLPTI